MNKTVPEIADILKINKLRIYRYIKKESIDPVKTVKGVQYFSDTAQNAIIKHFENLADTTTDTSDTSSDTSDTATDTADIEALKDEIIKRQDDEIKRLTKQIDGLQHTVEMQAKQFDQQQQLELESIRTFKATNTIEHHPDTSPDTKNDTSDTKNDTSKQNKKSPLFKWFKR